MLPKDASTNWINILSMIFVAKKAIISEQTNWQSIFVHMQEQGQGIKRDTVSKTYLPLNIFDFY